MSTTTTITTRAEALAALQDLTARERAAVRWLLAMAHSDGGDGNSTAGEDDPATWSTHYARRALPPRTVTRPRVVADPHDAEFEWRGDNGTVTLSWMRATLEASVSTRLTFTPERAAIIADLLANPTETVEADDDA